MKKILLKLPVLILLVIISTQCQRPHQVEYPETRMDDVVDNYFGVKVADPYRWLEVDNAPETKQWVEAQNQVTFDYLGRIPFREDFKNRLTEIWDHERYSTPFWEGENYFFYKNDGMQNQSVLYIRRGVDAEPEIFLDPNKMSEEGTVSITNLSISSDGLYMAYGLSTGGSDWNEIFVREIETGEDLEDYIQWVKFSGISWKGNGFYYSRYDEPAPGEELSAANENQKVYYHTLGTSQDKDRLVYENPAHPRRNYRVSTTDDERFLVLYESQATSGNAVYVKDLARGDQDFKQIIDGFDYSNRVIDHFNGKMLVYTNHEAPNYRLVTIDPDNPSPRNWNEVIPESEHLLRGVSLIGGRIISRYLVDVVSKAYVHNLNGGVETEIQLPAVGTMGGFSGKKDENIAFFSFSSFTFPNTIYQYDVKTNTYEIYFRPEIEFDPDLYESRQVFYTSKDGTRIPMFITHKKGLEMDGNNPTLLYGYGGFNASMTPRFSVARLALLENGGIYAVPNIRGGGEYGKEWHEAGTKLNKQNVFDDFIAAAEYLIEEGYTSPEKLAIQGGSNGGLLVGAVKTQRPELFKVAFPAVGVMDMLRFHQFTIGWAWVGDYGSSEDSVHFHNLYAYSPLHNIEEGVNYPATLVTTADHDDRVVPAHSYKYIAELQRKHEGPNPVLIRIETQAGHGAGKPTSKIIEETADIYSFMFYNMGLEPKY